MNGMIPVLRPPIKRPPIKLKAASHTYDLSGQLICMTNCDLIIVTNRPSRAESLYFQASVCAMNARSSFYLHHGTLQECREFIRELAEQLYVVELVNMPSHAVPVPLNDDPIWEEEEEIDCPF